jgi:hypothetical protein
MDWLMPTIWGVGFVDSEQLADFNLIDKEKLRDV